MKVILLSPLPPPSGGIAGWTLRMLSAKLKNDWSVAVVDEKLLGARNKNGGGYKKNMFVELQRCRQIYKELRELLKTPDTRVVQACIPATTGSMLREIISAKITHKYGKFFVTHFRCTVPNMIKTRLQRLILKFLISNSDCIFCLNKKTIDYIKTLNNRIDCRLIPNFVNIDEAYCRKEYSDSIKRIVYTGRIFVSKGCKTIIDVARKCPSIHFTLVGKIMMKTENIPSNVTLTGEKDRSFIKQELLNSDVFMFLTKYPGEGFSNSLAEAMAFSLPCIVTDWAANKEMIGEAGGIVLNSPTVENVVSAITSMQSHEKRANMGMNNYLRVINSFNQKSVTDSYVNAYEDIIKRNTLKRKQ